MKSQKTVHHTKSNGELIKKSKEIDIDSNFILIQQVQCKACNEMCSLEASEQHIKNCVKMQIKCEHCGQQIRRQLLPSHLQSECPKRQCNDQKYESTIKEIIQRELEQKTKYGNLKIKYKLLKKQIKHTKVRDLYINKSKQEKQNKIVLLDKEAQTHTSFNELKRTKANDYKMKRTCTEQLGAIKTIIKQIAEAFSLEQNGCDKIVVI